MRLQSLFISAAAMAFMPLAMAADFSKKDINQMIEEYIRDNPKVIVEALQNYQVQEQARLVQEQNKAVKELRSMFDKEDLHYGEAGNPNGDVLLVEFFDYNCGACKMMFNGLDKLLVEDKNVRVVFVEYPIFGPTSDMNAKISLALNALAPDKYFQFHSKAMSLKGKVTPDGMYKIAKELGVDVDDLKEEVKKDKYNKLIAKDRELGSKLQIRGTPAMIIGDTMANGAMNYEQLKEQVEQARADS